MSSSQSSGSVHQRKSTRPDLDRVPSNLATEWQAWMGSGPKEVEETLGSPKHGPWLQTLRVIGFFIHFTLVVLLIHGAQLLGSPLYFINKDYFYAWMSMTKQYFGLFATTMTHWWSPTVIRISGDKSMAGLIQQSEDGQVRMDLEERAVLMANHQIYTDWVYLWWVGYTNIPPMHGHIYIILKESLKWAPILGPAMRFYGFIFMARKWAKDQERMRYRLQKLSTRHTGPMSGTHGAAQLDPMWLLIFPEGTNTSANTRAGSKKYADKAGIPDLRHQLLPRSTGLQFCLQELKGTVEYLYDCTIGYEGIPPGLYGQDVFTLRSVYFQGRPPKSVNMHWRRYKISLMPITDHEAMAKWVLDRWREKDDMLEQFYKTGKFPGDTSAVEIEGGPREKEWKTAYVNTEVKARNPLEFLQVFAPVAAATMIGSILVRAIDMLLGKK
ncbi:hypothetical protein LTR62_006961 [Meristemomyces frigidus]|uniref:Phospholipid/glycerol acyltransferase domain-containing protein n=1 Tax=Meristemomyces frigidus TaxID=1508187 RepID=A0AAN7TCC7_9PEZI|nr:hypothetical protein LTR62_006961 [Meristemomyces frigidus]